MASTPSDNSWKCARGACRLVQERLGTDEKVVDHSECCKLAKQTTCQTTVDASFIASMASIMCGYQTKQIEEHKNGVIPIDEAKDDDEEDDDDDKPLCQRQRRPSSPNYSPCTDDDSEETKFNLHQWFVDYMKLAYPEAINPNASSVGAMVCSSTTFTRNGLPEAEALELREHFDGSTINRAPGDDVFGISMWGIARAIIDRHSLVLPEQIAHYLGRGKAARETVAWVLQQPVSPD